MSLRRIGIAVALVGVLAMTALSSAWFVQSGTATAQDEKSGPWRVVVTLGICGTTCDQYYMDQRQMKDMEHFNDISPAGDPNGSPMYAINVIAKLEQDGCEWQWQPYGTEKDRVVILFRC